jgi:hypothetical protein
MEQVDEDEEEEGGASGERIVRESDEMLVWNIIPGCSCM